MLITLLFFIFGFCFGFLVRYSQSIRFSDFFIKLHIFFVLLRVFFITKACPNQLTASILGFKLLIALLHFFLSSLLRFCSPSTAQKMKFSIKDILGKFDQNWSFLRIASHLLKKSSMEYFFCAVIMVSTIIKTLSTCIPNILS